MSPRLIVLFLLIFVFALVIRENMTKRPDRLHITTTGQVDMCLECHTKEKLDPAHDTKIMGCSSCHLGDSLAIDKEKAHTGIVLNPGDLRVVEKTCGVEGCHSPDVKKVKNSLMATNRGILATLLYYWGESPDQYGDYSVHKLMESGETSLALDYFRKLCGTCHLWKQRRDLPGFFGEKGGGCTACHNIMPAEASTAGDKQIHPYIVRKVPIENCVRCHNRSGRIGLSYTGVYEAEGYGTPYAEGTVSDQQLPGDRFFLNLPADVHYEKGMACIDCHTRNEIMGDGNRYAHYEEQLEITCESCHTKDNIGRTTKNNTLNNIEKDNATPLLTGKIDDKKHPLHPPREGVCDYAGHKRLTCESCHSTWVPQCYGCHVKRDMRDTHLDKLTLEETPGWWKEGRSFIRYEKPMLAVWDDQIVVVTPGCQDIVSLIDSKGNPTRQFNSLTMAAINPHTTQKKGRKCAECHASPKTIGLGEGTLIYENHTWRFTPTMRGVETAVGTTPPLDNYVTVDGTPLQKSSRKNLRPFNGKEIKRILRIGRCLPCHDSYNDPAYVDYSPMVTCPVFKE